MYSQGKFARRVNCNDTSNFAATETRKTPTEEVEDGRFTPGIPSPIPPRRPQSGCPLSTTAIPTINLTNSEKSLEPDNLLVY